MENDGKCAGSSPSSLLPETFPHFAAPRNNGKTWCAGPLKISAARHGDHIRGAGSLGGWWWAATLGMISQWGGCHCRCFWCSQVKRIQRIEKEWEGCNLYSGNRWEVFDYTQKFSPTPTIISGESVVTASWGPNVQTIHGNSATHYDITFSRDHLQAMWHTRNAHKCGSGGVVSADLIAIQLVLWISVFDLLNPLCIPHLLILVCSLSLSVYNQLN